MYSCAGINYIPISHLHKTKFKTDQRSEMLKPPEETGKIHEKGTASPPPQTTTARGMISRSLTNGITRHQRLKNYQQSETAMEWKELFDDYTSDMLLI